MIICPNCKHSEMEGTLFCSECGTNLMGQPSGDHEQPDYDRVHITIEFMDFSDKVVLSGKEKYVLGRSVKSQDWTVDVDLTPFNGYEFGVSRQHAMLKVDGMVLKVVDLNSSNRTFIDNDELLPGNEYVLENENVLRLGKMKMRVQMLFDQHG